MKLVSVNTSSPINIMFNNKEIATGICKCPCEGAVNVSQWGLEGDAIVDTSVHGGLDQAVYLYHKEDYDWWSDQLGTKVEYGMFGENLTISGVENMSWMIGDRITINDVELEITAPRIPCFKLAVRMADNQFIKKFAKACRPGAYARVIQEGILRVGDSLAVEKTTMDYASVKEVFSEWHKKDKSLALLKKALDSPIAKVHKLKIQHWYNEKG